MDRICDPSDIVNACHARIAISLLIPGLLLAGCATRYRVKIDSMARGDLQSRGVESFNLRSKQGDPDNLRFKEAAGHIRTALSAHGMFETADARADMVVVVDYAVGPTRMTYVHVEMPVFGQPPHDRSTAGAPSMDSPNTLVGYDRSAIAIPVCEKRLSISGYDNRGASTASPPRELWRIDVSIEDEGRDLRGYMPLLASAAMDRIGHDTGGMVTTTLQADDEAIRFIRKGM